MRQSYFQYTNKGGRPNNEDSISCSLRDGRGVYVLCDGLGGHSSGEVASALAADAIASALCDAEDLSRDVLSSAFKEANRRILDAQKEPDQEDMRTTAVALFIEGDRAIYGHIGDSRLYFFSGGQLKSITRDHSVTYMKYLGGEISYMDVYHDDDRSSLLRVLGKEDCRPEQGEQAVTCGDAFLLCSDGFWEYVYNEEMQADLLKSETPEQWIRFMLNRHIRRTPPGNDNFSVIGVFLEG